VATEPAEATRKASTAKSEPAEPGKRATNGNATPAAPKAAASPSHQPEAATAPAEAQPVKPENRPVQNHRIRTASHEQRRPVHTRNEEREASRSREGERRVAHDDGLASTREFVDRNGVRHIFLPRQMTGREREVFYGGRPRPFFSLGRADFFTDD
jgi:hypothetical protein